LVTGTSKGIGMATVLVLGRAGHTVYATMRNPSGAPELAQTAGKEGLPIHVSVMDVDSDTSVTEAIGAIEKPTVLSMSWSTTLALSVEAPPKS
jgi:NAD(P)-dependent dehydrogenase (short-subunit alcohol dehydrogenase family)